MKDSGPAPPTVIDETYPSAAVAPTARAAPLPPLTRDRAFWGLTITQFLGAFNDNLFKQLMLLLAIPVGAAAATRDDEQWYAMMTFSLPFILFSGYAGYLSDRFSKRTVIVLAKLAEIFIMALGMLAFLQYHSTGYAGLMVVLFLMGAHSAFFGPGKYGILPELFRGPDLPRANGIVLMTTFLAIIFGVATGGAMKQVFSDPAAPGAIDAGRMWIGSLACMGIAALGTVSSLLIRHTPPCNPRLKFAWSSLWIPPETRRVLASDRPLLLALLVSCMFWLISGIAISAVNSLGLMQLQLGDARTSVLTAVIGIGIAVGAVIAGRLCRGQIDFRATTFGAWGIIFCLVLATCLPLATPTEPGAARQAMLVAIGVSLVLLGIAAGVFVIPIQVFIQARPPEDQKGRMIAVMNLANFCAIFLAGPMYKLFDIIVNSLGWPRSPIFAMSALLIVPVALFYRPQRVEL